jgi:hypothetical protein
MKLIQKTILTGIAGTLATDVWTLVLKMFGVHSHGLLLVGQWIVSHLNPALQSRLMDKALFVGWTAHYCLGILFAVLPNLVYGKKWLQKPTLLMALMTGLISFLISVFIIQPILNFGIAFSRYTSQPVILLKVGLFHLVYSIGLWAAAKMTRNLGRILLPLKYSGHDA